MANLSASLRALRTPAACRPRSTKRFVYDIYLSREGDGTVLWRWRVWGKNGKVAANGGQAFSRRIDAVNICAALHNPGNASIFVNGEQMS